ncbi:hypothetical protein JL996_11080, partial [Acinetobacter baumannii]|nr:hypothetical protein [Acinetobacter baumannii]
GDWPAKNLLEFLRHLTDGDMLLRMKGGTPAFVDSLIKGIDIHHKNRNFTAKKPAIHT